MRDDALVDLPVEQPPAVRHYALAAVMMLLVVTALLMQRVPDVWSMVPLLLGVAFLFVQWREGPALVLVFVAWVLASEGRFGLPRDVVQGILQEGFDLFARGSRTVPVFDDVLIAGAFLLYAASHYRFVGLMRHLFPLDTRQQPYSGLMFGERRRVLEEPQRRSPQTVTPREFALLAAGVPLWVGGAALLWQWLMSQQPRAFVFDEVFAAALKLLYLFGIPLLLFRAAIAYSIQALAHRTESMMYLQDQLWRETRREQSRVNRWLTWARLRAERREEKT